MFKFLLSDIDDRPAYTQMVDEIQTIKLNNDYILTVDVISMQKIILIRTHFNRGRRSENSIVLSPLSEYSYTKKNINYIDIKNNMIALNDYIIKGLHKATYQLIQKLRSENVCYSCELYEYEDLCGDVISVTIEPKAQKIISTFESTKPQHSGIILKEEINIDYNDENVLNNYLKQLETQLAFAIMTFK